MKFTAARLIIRVSVGILMKNCTIKRGRSSVRKYMRDWPTADNKRRGIVIYNCRHSYSRGRNLGWTIGESPAHPFDVRYGPEGSFPVVRALSAPPLGNVGCRGSRGSRNFYGNEAAEWIDDGLSPCTATKSFRTRIGQDNGTGVSINSAN